VIIAPVSAAMADSAPLMIEEKWCE
jgi:hypothetical protein